jgi:NADPH oxidase
MGFFDEFKKQTRGTKLLFNILFHGGHIGLFALGWYGASLEDKSQ